jgi:hypothetical protein
MMLPPLVTQQLLDDPSEGARQVFLNCSDGTARQLRPLGDFETAEGRVTYMSRDWRVPRPAHPARHGRPAQRAARFNAADARPHHRLGLLLEAGHIGFNVTPGEQRGRCPGELDRGGRPAASRG